MCRHIAYLGPPCSLADLLIDRPHALLRQSWAPCDMRGGGTVNADGFGVGWFPGGETSGETGREPTAEPIRYRRSVPMWTDANFAALAPTITSGAVLAAVRSATVGMPVTETACMPFRCGQWLFSHNGRITDWPDSVAKLAEGLPVTDLLTMPAPTDAALLCALVGHRIRACTPAADAVADVVTEVGMAAPHSRLNLLLTDGVTIIATTWTHALSVLAGDDRVVVASEPWDDDPAWTEVPDRHLVLATRSGVCVRRLDN